MPWYKNPKWNAPITVAIVTVVGIIIAAVIGLGNSSSNKNIAKASSGGMAINGNPNIYNFNGVQKNQIDRHLKENEKGKLEKELGKIPEDVVTIKGGVNNPDMFRIYAAQSDDEAQQYAKEFVDFIGQIPTIQSLKTDVIGPSDFPFRTTDKSQNSGLLIASKDKDNPTQQAIAFRHAFESAGFNIQPISWPGLGEDQFLFVIGHNPG